MNPRPLSDFRLIGIALLASMIVAAVLFFDPFSAAPEAPEPVSKGGGPDLELIDATISRFQEDGAIKYKLRAPLIEHFEGITETALTEPDLTLYSAPEPPWHMTAERGTIFNASTSGSSGSEQVVLEEDVRMRQLYPDGRSFELRTPTITVYPDREYAETTRDVMITTHAGRTQAVGLEGNLREGKLQLFSTDEQRVHTVILPDQFK
ncbi:MAG: LPS export ABC transporter periplasmic protein LptC [Pseudomonadota bacterium]